MVIASLIALLFGSPAFAAQDLLAQCSVEMKRLDTNEPIRMTIRIVGNGVSVAAVITQMIGEYPATRRDVVAASEERVRPGLTAQSDGNDLNQAERLIVHAMILSEEPMFKSEYGAGFDLRKVRSAKMYVVGAVGNMGSSTIVEARDENDRPLGSFLGGFLVAPCR